MATNRTDTGSAQVGNIVALPNGAGDGVPADGPSKDNRRTDEALLNDFEELERATTLDGDEDDEPGSKEEVGIIQVVSKLPKFSRFRVNPNTTFDMWGVSDEAGMDRTIIVATKQFAPRLEEEVELRKVRFYETVTADGVVRLVYNFIEQDSKTPNTWLASKAAAMELAMTVWVTMRSAKKLQQYTFRRAAKDYGSPTFSGMTKGELIHQALRKPGLLVEDETHPFYRKAADLDDE